jgi:hypothetical protein
MHVTNIFSTGKPYLTGQQTTIWLDNLSLSSRFDLFVGLKTRFLPESGLIDI